jgi:uncharacterized protein (DUF2062 family)
MENFSSRIKGVYRRIAGINDNPQKIAAGFGLGLFFGVLPGTGPIASVVMASVFGLNRVSSLIGCLLINTWINVVTFGAAAQIGAMLTEDDWHKIYQDWLSVFNHFSWQGLLNHMLAKSFFPLLFGYFIIGAMLGAVGYVLVLVILARRKSV